ncbi:paraquat-inducible protein A [Tropicibacter naphthalenivorans]|uniref:Paraquat-inducible protein A n=1 Tax=Tropicibacter naphthalenivorans TaxID=441103 RepID=A0A0P1GX69_9RHOB|nr:paraquat-inducible protein A [Tropicibacter naphthalenivorans]CUH81083.1 Paraquat-inducible protein A [Tropicibacter naphthalenivorans]SMC97037.1 paraquat-inducible protein A [Tropicibacter naphthalenivorans]
MTQTIGPDDLAQLIACPNCDELYQARLPDEGERAVCHRCHTVLIQTRETAGRRVLALSIAVMILVIAAAFFPFLEISAAGIGNRVSLLDVATSFRSGTLVLVSVASVMLIVLVPLIRTVLLIYVIGPIELHRPPARYAKRAFHLAQELKPWAMTEVFSIGCAVALVKVSDLARLHFGPAFWMFAALSIFVLINDRYLCTWSIWNAIEDTQ